MLIKINIPTYRTIFRLKFYSKKEKILKENNKILSHFNDSDESVTFNGRSYDIYILIKMDLEAQMLF